MITIKRNCCLLQFSLLLSIVTLFVSLHAQVSTLPAGQPLSKAPLGDSIVGEPIVREMGVRPAGVPVEDIGDNEELVPFSFEKRPLVDIIDFLAAKRGVNVILPQLAADAEAIKKQTITYTPQGRTSVPLSEAWSLLTMFLELSGFSLVPKRPGLYAIVKVGKPEEAGVTRETLPLYIGTPFDQLPHSEQRIRYIYYLRNLKTPGPEDKDTNPLARIFKDMLSPGAPVIPEPKSNGFIIVDKANVVASVMRLITELDATGFRETVEVIPVYNVPARDIVKVFDALKKAAGEAAGTKVPFLRSSKGDIAYFAADTKIIADDRTNTLILMGRQSAVERISEFIHEYVDTPPESGQSILHTYDLQYLDAQTFAKTLQDIVAPHLQAAQATQGPAGGPERAFQGVVVAAEEIKEVEIRTETEEVKVEETPGGFTPEGIQGKIFTGGNRLIIAAIQADWERIRDFIEALDHPQPQVILEVMILDLTDQRERRFQSTFRNITNGPLQPNLGVQFLESHITPPRNVLNNPPVQLADDLLTLITTADTNAPQPVTSFLAPRGQFIVSFNDPVTPGIFGLIALFDQRVETKILSHPYLVTTNNQKATVTSQIIKRARGDAIPGAAGVTTVEIVDVSATIQVQMIPRLSSLDRLGLQVAVDINDFIGITLDRITRRVNTNANLSSGEILVIGGLTRTDVQDIITETPFLSKIPLIGYLFKGVRKLVIKTNVAIFIAPTIVQPKLRGGLNLYTADKLRKVGRDISDTAVFGGNSDRDPITRVFFNTGPKGEHIVQSYLADVANPPNGELIKPEPQRRYEKRRPRRRTIPQKEMRVQTEIPA